MAEQTTATNTAPAAAQTPAYSPSQGARGGNDNRGRGGNDRRPRRPEMQPEGKAI